MSAVSGSEQNGSLAHGGKPLAVPRRLLRLRSDAVLAERFAAGDQAAFDVIYERHRPVVLAVCMGVLGTMHDAEDATQESFSALAVALRSTPPSDVRPWLIRVARNAAIDTTRRRKHRLLTLDGELPEIPSQQGTSSAELEAVMSGIRELPENQRTALLMRELSGHSYAEIAAFLETDEDAVRGLIARARVGMRSHREATELPCAVARLEIETEPDGRRYDKTVRRHLRTCQPCREYRTALRGDAKALRAALPLQAGGGLLGGGGVAAGTITAVKGALAGLAVTQAAATCAASVCAVGAVGGLVLMQPSHHFFGLTTPHATTVRHATVHKHAIDHAVKQAVAAASSASTPATTVTYTAPSTRSRTAVSTSHSSLSSGAGHKLGLHNGGSRGNDFGAGGGQHLGSGAGQHGIAGAAGSAFGNGFGSGGGPVGAGVSGVGAVDVGSDGLGVSGPGASGYGASGYGGNGSGQGQTGPASATDPWGSGHANTAYTGTIASPRSQIVTPPSSSSQTSDGNNGGHGGYGQGGGSQSGTGRHSGGAGNSGSGRQSGTGHHFGSGGHSGSSSSGTGAYGHSLSPTSASASSHSGSWSSGSGDGSHSYRYSSHGGGSHSYGGGAYSGGSRAYGHGSYDNGSHGHGSSGGGY